MMRKKDILILFLNSNFGWERGLVWGLFVIRL